MEDSKHPQKPSDPSINLDGFFSHPLVPLHRFDFCHRRYHSMDQPTTLWRYRRATPRRLRRRALGTRRVRCPRMGLERRLAEMALRVARGRQREHDGRLDGGRRNYGTSCPSAKRRMEPRRRISDFCEVTIHCSPNWVPSLTHWTALPASTKPRASTVRSPPHAPTARRSWCGTKSDDRRCTGTTSSAQRSLIRCGS